MRRFYPRSQGFGHPKIPTSSEHFPLCSSLSLPCLYPTQSIVEISKSLEDFKGLNPYKILWKLLLCTPEFSLENVTDDILQIPSLLLTPTSRGFYGSTNYSYSHLNTFNRWIKPNPCLFCSLFLGRNWTLEHPSMGQRWKSLCSLKIWEIPGSKQPGMPMEWSLKSLPIWIILGCCHIPLCNPLFSSNISDFHGKTLPSGKAVEEQSRFRSPAGSSWTSQLIPARNNTPVFSQKRENSNSLPL